MIKMKWQTTAWLTLYLFSLSSISEGAEKERKIKNQKHGLLLIQKDILSTLKDKDILINPDSKIFKRPKKTSTKKNLTGPPGPPGPPGSTGLPGVNFQFNQDNRGELNFEVSLFQIGVSKISLLNALPYVVCPSGKVITGKSVTINLSNISADSFIDLFSISCGGESIKISSPEYGVYQIGVHLFAQTPIQREFNLNLAANVTAVRGETLLTTVTEIIPSGLQTILRNQSTEIQIHAAYFYGPFETTIP